MKLKILVTSISSALIESIPVRTFWKIIGITMITPIQIVRVDPRSVIQRMSIKVATGIALMIEIIGARRCRKKGMRWHMNARAVPIIIPSVKPIITRKNEVKTAV